MRCFAFSGHQVFDIQCVVYPYSTAQFTLAATFYVLSSLIWPVVPVLNSEVLSALHVSAFSLLS